MKNKFYKTLLTVLTLLVFSACNEQHTTTSDNAHKEGVSLVEISADQAKLISLKTAKLEWKELSGVIQVNGMLDVPPQNLVSISAPMGGFVKQSEMLQGMKVKKGDEIAVLQHPDYIQLQQDYLEAKSELSFLETEYRRQEDLAKDKVNSQKTLQQSKTQYEKMLAKSKGLESKLRLIGIAPEKLAGGNIQESLVIVSPINGYISKVNVNIGKFVNPTDVMFEIVDTEHLHAELTLFEKDVPKVKIGQKVKIILSNESTERTATVYLIGREISAERTVNLHCHLDKEDLNLFPGSYLTAFIETGGNKVSALPNEAIVNFEGKDYVFVLAKEANHYQMVEIDKGVSELGYTEINSKSLTAESIIVISGSFDLLAKLKNSEEEGGHTH